MNNWGLRCFAGKPYCLTGLAHYLDSNRKQSDTERQPKKRKTTSPPNPIHTPKGNLKKQNQKQTARPQSRSKIKKTLNNPQTPQRGSAGNGLGHNCGTRRKQKGAVLKYCSLLVFEYDTAVRQTSPAGSRSPTKNGTTHMHSRWIARLTP